MAASWTRSDHELELSVGGVAAHLDLLAPALGLTRWRHDGHPLSDLAILGVDLPPLKSAAGCLAEGYVRQGDAVAIYRPTLERPFTVEVYWRADLIETSAAAVPVVDLLVSIQTDLLDSHPTVDVVTRLPRPARTWTLSPSGQFHAVQTGQCLGHDDAVGWLLEWSHAPLGYLQLSHPDDAGRRQWTPAMTGGPAEIREQLFADFLEKGVIRRARLRSALVPAPRLTEVAGELLAEFLARPLPLTT